MSTILRFIPIPMLLLLAGLAAAAATLANVYYEVQKTTAREVGPPEAIVASDLGDVRGFPWFEEVTVQVQIEDSLTYVFREDSADGTVTEYPVLFFFDPSQQAPVREVLGAFAYDTDTAEEMDVYLKSVQLGTGSRGPIFKLTGVPPIRPSVTHDEIQFAAEELGVTLAPNFLYLKPHFQGRDTHVAARSGLTYAGGMIAILFIWASMLAQIMRRRRRHAEALGVLAG